MSSWERSLLWRTLARRSVKFTTAAPQVRQAAKLLAGSAKPSQIGATETLRGVWMGELEVLRIQPNVGGSPSAFCLL